MPGVNLAPWRKAMRELASEYTRQPVPRAKVIIVYDNGTRREWVTTHSLAASVDSLLSHTAAERIG